MHAKLSLREIPQPLTYQFLSLHNMVKAAYCLPFPVIVKPVCGMHGRGLRKFDCQRDLLHFLKLNKLSNYLIQEWLPCRYYYRVMVIGTKVLGAIRRLSLKCDNRPKLPISKRSNKAKLYPALCRLALQAAKACDLEIAGVDIMPKGRNLYVLEANRSPKFIRFRQVLGINVETEIIKYLNDKIDSQ
jgi:ribosomal protein S6--L-glutamate ligase